MNDPAEILVDRAKMGDFTAASELIHQSYTSIFAYFRRLAGTEEDAADLTQKTFVQVWHSLAQFSRRSSFKTWIHSIAHHVYVDWRRQPNRSDAKTDEWWEGRATDAPTPLESTMERDAARQVYAAVDQLADDQRETIHLHYFQGLTLQETAEALGVATSTVKYRLRGALEALQSQLAEPKIPA